MSSGQILVCMLISTLSLVLLSDNRERVKHVWTANSHMTVKPVVKTKVWDS